MWWLAFIPDSLLQFFVHAVTIIGLAGIILGSVARHIIFIEHYGLVIRIVGAVMFVAGVFFEGGYATEMAWRARVEELQAKLAIAEQQSADANAALEVERLKKQKVITQTVTEIQERIVEKEKVINAECKISDEAEQIYRRAVKGPAEEKK